jgi:hypothetical protein
VGVAEDLDDHPEVAVRSQVRGLGAAELAAENCAVLAVLGEETGGDALLVERLDQLPLRLADGGDGKPPGKLDRLTVLPEILRLAGVELSLLARSEGDAPYGQCVARSWTDRPSCADAS